MKPLNCRILLVEDEVELCELFRAELVERGARVETAHNGLQALEILSQVQVDILITDMKMPSMGGRALILELLTRAPTSRPEHIILMTGDLDSPWTAEEMENPFISAIKSVTKPFTFKTLLQNLGRFSPEVSSAE